MKDSDSQRIYNELCTPKKFLDVNMVNEFAIDLFVA